MNPREREPGSTCLIRPCASSWRAGTRFLLAEFIDALRWAWQSPATRFEYKLQILASQYRAMRWVKNQVVSWIQRFQLHQRVRKVCCRTFSKSLCTPPGGWFPSASWSSGSTAARWPTACSRWRLSEQSSQTNKDKTFCQIINRVSQNVEMNPVFCKNMV